MLANRCSSQSTFTRLLDSLNPSASPINFGQEASMTKSTQSMLHRITRSRQHFGSYRHDLLVALRLVGTVEKEVVRAEWENWVLSESARCKHVQSRLHNGEDTAALRDWWNQYCISCIAAASMNDIKSSAIGV
jgi:hypothetical protein